MKKNCISKTKSNKSSNCFWGFFADLFNLMAGLIEGSRILVSASAFCLGPYVVLMEEYEENLAPHGDMYLQGEKNILIAFSDNCSSLILYQNLANGSFFIFRCNVKLEASNNKVSYSSIKIHWSVWHLKGMNPFMNA